MNQSEQQIQPQLSAEDCRKLWLEATEQMIENAELKKRIEILEREIAINAFAGWSVH